MVNLAAASLLIAGTLGMTVWQDSRPRTRTGSKSPPIVTAIGAPAGTESLPVTWVTIAAPHKKPVETAYCDGCGHNAFFTNSTQRDHELQRMTDCLRRHLGR